MNPTPTPHGYLADSQGRLVALENIRPIDLARDELVAEVLTKALHMQALLAQFKAEVMADMQAFIDLSAERYGVKLGGQKGNVSLSSYNGDTRVLRAISDTLAFDEGLQAAKVLIDQCIDKWTADSRPEIRTLINDAFQVDKQGLINTSRVLSLRRLAIDDPDWQTAMQALSDSLRVQCSTSYIRIERRIDGKKFEAVRLDLAGV